MSITAKELAKKLNLSAAAVSMALNGKPGVSTETRKLVREAAEQYGYDFTRISEKHQTTGSIYFVIYKKHGATTRRSSPNCRKAWPTRAKRKATNSSSVIFMEMIRISKSS